MAAELLTDSFGRRISDLRVSVTDRCNFRCQYCMPAEGLDWIERDGILTYEEIERLVGILGAIGIEDVRLTGGEPLVRRDLPQLIGRLKGLGTIRDLALTTNGYLLERHAEALAEAGLDRINVSIDSLEQDRFFRLTRRDALPQVLTGLEAIMAQPGINSVKVNAVAIRGFTEVELPRFCELARTSGCQVRFIEFMPLDGDRSWDPSQVLTGAELRLLIEGVHPLVEVEREPSATARVFRFADGEGEVGFISPVSEPFCSDCNRLRLTADGKLRTCLFSLNETDLLGPLRDGTDDAGIEALIRNAVRGKELRHRINEAGFQQPDRTMSAIGG
ncbi:MAG: GTP 3',8-cyclase MoaA [Thermoleophilia bacterium]|nr:GTP 3',8-cyclase MoaA [Thermoleophilia bacterium]